MSNTRDRKRESRADETRKNSREISVELQEKLDGCKPVERINFIVEILGLDADYAYKWVRFTDPSGNFDSKNIQNKLISDYTFVEAEESENAGMVSFFQPSEDSPLARMGDSTKITYGDTVLMRLTKEKKEKRQKRINDEFQRNLQDSVNSRPEIERVRF